MEKGLVGSERLPGWTPSEDPGGDSLKAEEEENAGEFTGYTITSLTGE